MSELKLFCINNGIAEEVPASAFELEKPLQNFFEKNLEPLLGIRFLASEYSTGRRHNGRIDTLGLDENNCPVIIEYKRQQNENIINQGLFYLDWLLDHRPEFDALVKSKLGAGQVNTVEWSSPRVLCIAKDFTRFDEYAVFQIDRNIELLRYKLYKKSHFLLERVNHLPSFAEASTAEKSVTKFLEDNAGYISKAKSETTAIDLLNKSEESIKVVYAELRKILFSFGDDVNEKSLKTYIAFSRIRSFITVEPLKNKLNMWLRLDPELAKEEQYKIVARDVSNIGHHGVGNLEIAIDSLKTLMLILPLLQRAYDEA